MAINFNFAKKFAAEQIIKRALNYIEKDPDRNFIKVLDLLEKIARTENHKEEIASLRREYKKNPAIKQYIKKFTEIAPSYKEGLVMNFFINSGLLGIPYQFKMAEKLGVDVPWTILIDPTSACNLNCTGCWAGKYSKSDRLEFEVIDRIITEAKELGIYFIVLSGGEPTLYPRLFDIFEKHQDVGFLMYTNGTLIDEEMADRMVEVGNVSPAISIEGFKEEIDGRRGEGVFDKIMHTMDLLRDRGVVFGASVTVTRNNVDELFGKDDFIELLIEKGATYVWSFHYVPIGKDPNLDLMLTPEQRKFMAYKIPEIRSQKPIFVADFWNDGTFTGGCIAGGRRYFHINAKGEVEPCAFVHFSVDNIKEKSLKEVLQNPLFKSYQKRQPFNENLMLPCPIIDNPHCLREIVEESGAKPTHEGADTVLKGDVAKGLDKMSSEWSRVSKPIFEERMGKPASDDSESKLA
ncbi:radical SAM protein [Halothermothrix orenii]|uniref:Radical SAM domain protein n=1 Tax=Halothermothrix orenii (strain H 168 / OCM 544 / DSM 9562) TaxID=373903 RepID=B8CYJ0_HALOH|nr:radical SAM protein [Halothermothrix orenii]ACL70359.1 Radical SAM domain protein [Halothermothrix orenii H 168]